MMKLRMVRTEVEDGTGVKNELGAVSRAGVKLAGVVRELGVDFRGKLVLDIGASTGGFTELALGAGARKVIAVEKGTRQMKAPLRFDERVELHEKTDIFKFDTIEWPEVILADVSFVSLTKILAYVKMKGWAREAELLVLMKPQFEADKEELREGVVKNSRIRREIIQRFEGWLKENGFVILGKRDSVLKGRFGNEERFYYLRCPA